MKKRMHFPPASFSLASPSSVESHYRCTSTPLSTIHRWVYVRRWLNSWWSWFPLWSRNLHPIDCAMMIGVVEMVRISPWTMLMITVIVVLQLQHYYLPSRLNLRVWVMWTQEASPSPQSRSWVAFARIYSECVTKDDGREGERCKRHVGRIQI